MRDDDDDEELRKPIWRRPAVIFMASASATIFGLCWYISSRPAPPPPPPPKPSYEAIKVTQPYVREAVSDHPAPVVAAPAAPTAEQIIKAAQEAVTATPTLVKPVLPAMMSFAPPKPVAAPTTPAAPEVYTRMAYPKTEVPIGRASAAQDDTFWLMPGLLPLVLDTAISSDVPEGTLFAHTYGPIYSEKNVLLMPAGTRIVGKYTGLKGGSNRLQAVSVMAWVNTPQGKIAVPLTDNFVDDLGRTGLDGAVDHRYVERFGAAIALELSQGVLGYLQATASKGGNTYLSLNQGGGVGGLAEQILNQTINLPAIFTKHQGETVAISISQPISFEDSYRLRGKK